MANISINSCSLCSLEEAFSVKLLSFTHQQLQQWKAMPVLTFVSTEVSMLTSYHWPV